ncbi:glycosyltransferase family 2 protein [Bacteroides sp.]|uniref:glycosyltransferase family 2 protein n=1 Tax=Bacteroides sp. TaxID=29523 RepID=UPI002620037A|nr:glycosyltransferase family 2 protein [Bacteroides sp.]MDD3040120.1 glycosyltransferase family 2 protein [Bacteroides sp.]
MKFSIIIPIYKVEDYIAECLYSVIHQTYKDGFECILVDDNTPDDSMKIVRQVLSSYRGNIQFKIVHHQENKGLSAARNTGVREATGDYLYFLDSDDLLPEQTIESLLKTCQNESPDVVMGDFELIGESDNVPKLNTQISNYNNQVDIFNAFISRHLYEMAWNKLVRKDFFLRHELWFREGILHEDSLWSFFLFYYCQNLKICFSNTYRYRIRQNSIMTDPVNTNRSYRSCFEIYSLKMGFIEKCVLFQKCDQLIKYMVDEKFSLQRKMVDLGINNEEYVLVKNTIGFSYILKKGLSSRTRVKIIISSFPLNIFKLVLPILTN